MIFDEELDSRALREKRFRMVEDQLRMRSIFDKRVLESIKRTPRHLFVDEKYAEIAYGDHPLPLKKNQSINHPYMIGLMMQSLEVRPQHKVLVVGTGSGFQAALIGEVATQVYTTEVDKELYQDSKAKLKAFGYKNITCSEAKKVIGWSTHAPYDRILVTGSMECVPKELMKQLSPKGILVAAVRKKGGQQDIIKIAREDGEHVLRTVHTTQETGKITDCKMTPHEF